MTAQKREHLSKNLEERVTSLETELAKIKQILAESGISTKQAWWLNVAGSFEYDSTFDEATRFGQEWRQSANRAQ